MRRLLRARNALLLAPLLFATCLPASTASARTIRVTRADDSGRGSLRAALDAASRDDSIDRIEIDRRRVSFISASSTLTYSGTQPLEIDGGGATVSGGGGAFDLLRADGGASLTIARLTLERSGAGGIVVDVPATAEGTIAITLVDARLRGHAEEALRVDERSDGVGGGSTSSASIALVVIDSRIEDSGTAPGLDDVDGVRVDEGGAGDVFALLVGARVEGNAFDGIELDEEGEGSVRVQVLASRLSANGGANDVFTEPDDGLDVDEAGPGDLDVAAVLSSFDGNFDQGLDLDESGDGSITLSLALVQASANGGEGVKASEEDGGALTASLVGVRLETNGDDGAQLEEADAGDVLVRATDLLARGSAKDGLKVSEDDDGSLTLEVRRSRFEGADDDGLQIEEGGAGDLRASFDDVSVTENAGAGIKAEEGGSGSGTLTLGASCVVDGNGDDPLDLDDVELAPGG